MNTKFHTSGKNFTLIVILSLFGMVSESSAAFMRLQMTPYDKQMAPVHNVLHRHASRGVEVDYKEVMHWMRQIRNFRYSDTDTWHTPAQTLKRRAGDCKDKAILLLDYFKSKGCADVKLVIGKLRPSSKVTHAWVEWKHEGKWIILDPTYDRKPIFNPRQGDYAKQYAFMGGRKYAYIPKRILTAGL